MRLLELAFAGCSRVVVTKLHGGFSGSLVLKTNSYGPDGTLDEPTVTKLDDAVSMLDEVKKTAQFTKLVGASAAQVQRGQFLVDASGESIEAGASTKDDFGCIVLDMAGACWVMPEFYGKLDAEMISTFKRHLVRQLAVQPSSETYVDAMTVMQELWGAGGPLRVLALKTCKRSETLATKPEGLIERALHDITTSLIVAFRAPNGEVGSDPAKPYSTPVLLDGCINKVLKSRTGWLTKLDGRRDRSKIFKNSLVHDCEATVWRDEDTCKALVSLIEQLESLLQPTPEPTWLAEYKPLRMHQHGDLNCGNILIDVRESLWLIDFATAGEKALFVDAAKMVSVILFEQFPVPITLAELRGQDGSQKLVDALGSSEAEATDLARLVAACETKVELVEKVKEQEATKQHLDNASSSNAKMTKEEGLQRFLPFIEDHAVAEKRAEEAFAVIDLLFKPGADGKQPQLWEMANRQPPKDEDWSAYALLALQLCTRVMKVTMELVAECSRREQKADAFASDLHAVHFLLPLLTRALCSVRYFQCGAWQKRIAWYAARRLAEVLTPLLRQPPMPLPASTNQVLATELQLVAGQPIAMLDTVGRLDGGLGQKRRGIFLVSADGEPLVQHLISDETHPLAFDQVDQTVLPWRAPGPETVGAILEAAQQDLVTTVPALAALLKTIPSIETLSSERAQGANGAAVSSLIERLRATPKSQALQDRVERQVKKVCSDTLAKVDKLRKSLEHVLTFGTLQETVEALAIDQLTNIGGLNVRSYAIGQRLLVHQNGAWLEQAVAHSERSSAQHQLEANGGQLSITLHPWNHAPLVLPLASFEALRSRHASNLRSQHA